jgi:hypothetical protein
MSLALRPTETELARPVVAWLQDFGWDIYQEVQTRGGGRADIVAVRGILVFVVEVKASLSLRLLDQAVEWLAQAHYVAIATPPVRTGFFVHRCLRDLGIGRFHSRAGCGGEGCDLHEPAELHRWAEPKRIRAVLHESQKTAIAGSNGGGYWTPFRQTCTALVEFVSANPGCTLKAAIDGIRHHYSSPASARNSLRDWILRGKIPRLTYDEQTRTLKVTTQEAA